MEARPERFGKEVTEKELDRLLLASKACSKMAVFDLIQFSTTQKAMERRKCQWQFVKHNPNPKEQEVVSVQFTPDIFRQKMKVFQRNQALKKRLGTNKVSMSSSRNSTSASI